MQGMQHKKHRVASNGGKMEEKLMPLKEGQVSGKAVSDGLTGIFRLRPFSVVTLPRIQALLICLRSPFSIGRAHARVKFTVSVFTSPLSRGVDNERKSSCQKS